MPHASLCNIFSKVQLVLGTSKHSINKLHISIGVVPLPLLKDSIQCPYGTFCFRKQFLTRCLLFSAGNDITIAHGLILTSLEVPEGNLYSAVVTCIDAHIQPWFCEGMRK